MTKENKLRGYLETLRRLKFIVDALRAGRRVNVSSLAEELERSGRTIKRDIAALRSDFNAPISFDRESNSFLLTEKGWRF